MNNTTTYTIIGIIVVAIIAIFAFSGNQASAPSDTNGTTTPTSTPEMSTTTTNEDDTVDGDAADAEDVIVTYTNSGFQPAEVTVSAGTEVVFKNTSTHGMWPASAVHPTHAEYDGTTLREHCNNGTTTFDACTEIAPGVSWSYTFDKTGEWNYHNHVSPSDTGTVIVE